MRGERPQGEGRSLSTIAHSPLSLRSFPSRSPFPYPHLSKLRVFFVHCISKGLRSTEGKGIRKAGARGRKPKGKGRPERSDDSLSPWVVTPVSWGEMTHGIEWSKLGEVMPANFNLFEFAYIRAVCSRYTKHIRRALDQRRPALPANSDLSQEQ